MDIFDFLVMAERGTSKVSLFAGGDNKRSPVINAYDIVRSDKVVTI